MSTLSNPRQLKAIAALLAGAPIPKAAAAAGCAETTVRRWLREDAQFTAALAEGRREALRGALDVSAAVARSAVGVVEELMGDRSAPPGVRLRAACAMLEMLAKWTELADFDARLRALEGEHVNVS